MSSSSEALTTADVHSHAPPPSIWSAVREALQGAHGRDFTEGPIGRAIFILAIPMVLEMLMESVFVVVDVWVVSHLGADAVATVGLTESFMTIVYTLAIGLSIGASAIVARRIGEKNADGAAHSGAQVILLGLILAACLGVVGALFAPHLLRVMGASDGVLANVSFTRIMLGMNASVVMLFLVNSILRSSGDAAFAMRALWLANGINIVLGPSLVLGLGPFPKLGIIGAAIATSIGRSTGALYAFAKLRRADSRVRIASRHFAFDPALIMRVVRLSSSATFQVLIGTASWIGLTRILATFGSQALAGYTIAMRIVMFALLPAFGLSNAAATMVGQALGARKPDRAESSVWKAALYNVAFLGTVGLLFVLFTRPVIAVFTHDPGVAQYGIATLRTVSYGFLFYAYGMVLTQSFNGAGDTATPTWINLFVFWLFEIPLAWVLAVQLGMGPNGVAYALMAAFSILAVVSAVLFRRGTWKTRRV